LKRTLKVSTAIVTIATLTALGNPAFAQSADKPADSDENVGIADIVVTATRREESANRIPVAIQAIGGEQLANLNVTNFEKLVEYLPNVRTASRGPGISSIYIRGLSTDTAGAQILGVAGVQPNVALYLNDAPASTPGRNLDIHPTDFERVEVLAGPQGTLFGANAMGGAIRYITNKPNLTEFQAGFTMGGATTKGGAASYSAEGFINLPIVNDKLAVRLAVYSDHQGGYIDNVLGTYQMPWNPGGPGRLPTGNPLLVEHAIQSCVGVVNCVATATGTTGGFRVPIRQSITNTAFIQDNYNDANYNGGRATLTYKINEDWSLEAMTMYQELETDGVFDYAPAVGDLKVQQYSPNTLRDTIKLSTLTLQGRLGMLDMILTSSYQDHQAQQQADYAKYASFGLYMPFYNCDRGVYYAGYATSAAQGQTCYSPANSYKVNNRNTRWTHEFRVTTPSENRLRGTLGLFYDSNKIEDVTQWNYVQPAAGFVYNLAPHPSVNVLGTGVLPGAGFANTILRKDRQFAIYGEASFDLIPEKLTITGGARYYDEKASMDGGSSSSFAGGIRYACNTVNTNPVSGLTTCNYTPLAVAPTSLAASSVLTTRLAGINPTKYSGVLLKGNLSYKITPDSLVYFTYSEGFRPGGFNRKGCNNPNGSGGLSAAQCSANRAYSPDNVTNYEVGAKLSLMDRKLQINMAAYLIDWKSIQMATFDQNISNQTFISNLANARIKGFEGDITARPIPELTLSAGFSYNDSELTSYVPALQVLGQRVLVPLGSPLALSPKFQGNLRMRYEWETGSGLKPFLQLGFHHVGSTITSDISNSSILYTGCRAPYSVCGQTSVINGVTVNAGSVIQPQPSSFAQPGYNTFEASVGMSKDQWSATLYIDNAGNERPQLFTSANDGEVRVTTTRPRTIGMRVSYKM
jgi:outer membrane receptor protein involved in Fe transport